MQRGGHGCSVEATGIGRTRELTSSDVAGSFQGTGGCCAPKCLTIQVCPACNGGVCFAQLCFNACPCLCCYAFSCGNGQWCHCSNEGLKFVDADTLHMDGGVFKRVGSPDAVQMVRE